MNRSRTSLVAAVLLILACLVLVALPAHGQGVAVGKDKVHRTGTLLLPYAFYNQGFGASAGVVYGSTGFPQKQATLIATLIGGSNSAAAFYGLARDMQAPFLSERLFLDADLALSTFGTIYSYNNGNPAYRGRQQAGTNESSDENWIRGPGTDNIARVKFRFLLPIGTGRDQIISTYVMDRGLLVEGAQGGTSWNPLKSGKTYLEARPFWRAQEVRSHYNRLYSKTNGVDFSLVWNNTDLPANPSEGSSLRTRYTADFGYFDSSTKYDVIDVEWSKYFSFGESERFRQRVLAFDVWTANTPSWDDHSTRNSGQRVYERPPGWAGATLGGLWRMRAYPTGRFHDQAALYYSAEYRVIPQWNPFDKVDWIRKHLGIAWWQWVPFVEAGRVAPDWDPRTLHTKMKWDAGLGVRAVAKGIVVRIDAAMGNAGNWGVNMMVGQPFNF